jgi:hypothetical protein
MATLLIDSPGKVETIARPHAPPTQRLPRWFSVGMALAAVAVVMVGFWPSFYARPSTMPVMRPVVIAHGVMFSSWIALFVVQTVLVATRHVRIHRWLGVAGAGLAATMAVTAPVMAVGLARRGEPARDPLVFFLVITTDVVLFAAFVSAAISYRRRAETHRRLMLLSLVTLLPAALSRWPWIVRHLVPGIMGVSLLFLAAAPIADLVARRRPHAISLWGGLVLLVSLPLRFAIAQTAAWHQFARWLIR